MHTIWTRFESESELNRVDTGWAANYKLKLYIHIYAMCSFPRSFACSSICMYVYTNDEHLTSHKFFNSNLARSRWENCVADCAVFSLTRSLTQSFGTIRTFSFQDKLNQHTHTHTQSHWLSCSISFFLDSICISMKAFVYYVLSVCMRLSLFIYRSPSLSLYL